MVDEGTQALNISIVEEVKKRPLLYNYRTKDFYKKNLVYAAWAEVGEQVCLSASQCKDRWNCFKIVLRRHLNQELKGRVSKKPYYLREPMKFFIPYIRTCDKPGSSDWKPKPKIVKVKSEKVVQPEESTSAAGLYQATSTCNDDEEFHDSQEMHQEKNEALNESQDLDPVLNGDEVYSNLDVFNFSSESSNDIDSNCKAKKAKLESDDEQREANKMFLLSLLPDMKRMNESELRKFKKGVMDSIHSILGRD